MTGRTHLIVGTATGTTVSLAITHTSPGITLTVVALSALSSLLPDIDHPSSTLSIAMPPAHWLYRIVISNPLTWLVFGFSRARAAAHHRSGLAHSLVGLVLTTLAVASMATWFHSQAGLVLSVAWCVGYTSHLLLDMLTAEGVALFAPFTSLRIGILPRPVRRMLGWAERNI